MQTADRTGIACDLCHTTYNIDFEYYSFEFRKVSVYQNRRPALEQIFRTPIKNSIDVCSNCFDGIKRLVVSNYARTMSDNPKNIGKQTPNITCEISGIKLSGDFDYYHCNVVYATVRMSGQPNICTKCNSKTFDKTKPCQKCGNNNYTSIANITTDNRHVEINVSEPEYLKMINRVETQENSSKWSTSS
jgi:hypothetical protein